MSVKRFLSFYRSRLFHLVLEEYSGWIVRNLPGFLGISIRYVVYNFLFKEIGSFAKIYPGVFLVHTYGIRVGKNFSVNSGAMLDGRGGISIGDDVMIGPNVVLVSSDHNSEKSSRPMSESNHILKPTFIGSDVWIGANVVIVGGVTIGNGVVVAAGSVVTKNIEDFKVVGGIPAEIIKDRI